MKTVSIVQSNYIPWKGYFDIIGLSDEFVLFDTVQYTRRDWRNRNHIKVAAGDSWLSIPVKTRGLYDQSIQHTEISDASWAERHWAKLQSVYRGLDGFKLYAPAIQSTYEEAASETHLSAVNRLFIERICGLLGIDTVISNASDYPAQDGKTERLVGLCKATGANRYISGPAAAVYIESEQFAANAIDLVYMDYSGYPEYPQINPPFQHGVSVLDLLFSVGEAAPQYMKFKSTIWP